MESYKEESKFPTKYGIQTNKTLKRNHYFKTSLPYYINYKVNDEIDEDEYYKKPKISNIGKGDRCHQCKEKEKKYKENQKI